MVLSCENQTLEHHCQWSTTIPLFVYITVKKYVFERRNLYKRKPENKRLYLSDCIIHISEVILKWVNVTCQLEFKNRNWERLQNILLNGKPRALSMVKSQLAWQPVDTVNSVTSSPVQLQAWEQRSCLSLLPLDCQEKVQLVGWVKQLFLKKRVESTSLGWLIII